MKKHWPLLLFLAFSLIALIAATTKLDNRTVDFTGSQLSFNAQSSLTNEDGLWGMPSSQFKALSYLRSNILSSASQSAVTGLVSSLAGGSGVSVAAGNNITATTNSGLVTVSTSPHWTNNNGLYSLVQTNDSAFHYDIGIGPDALNNPGSFTVAWYLNYPGLVGPYFSSEGSMIGGTNITHSLYVYTDGVTQNQSAEIDVIDYGNDKYSQRIMLSPPGGPVVSLSSTNAVGKSGFFIDSNTAIRDNGTLRLNNVEYVTPATNYLPGQVWTGNGATPNQISFTPQTFDKGSVRFPTNAIADWLTAASTRGGCAFVNSNATLYVLTSTPNSTAWAATNKIAGP